MERDAALVLARVELSEQRAAAAAREVNAACATRLAPADAHVHLAFAHEVEEARRLALLLQPLAVQCAALLEGVAELLHLVKVRVGVRLRIRVRVEVEVGGGIGVRVRVRVGVMVHGGEQSSAPGSRSSLGYRPRHCAATPPSEGQ